jgi:predicted  nucleic acid-binding Zn-ribbon protein
MSLPKGGRGKQAPYKTIQVRCPEPIKPIVQEIIRQFHEQGTENLNTGITEAQETKVAELEASLTVVRNSVEPLKRENERLREQIKEYRQKLENSAQSSEADLEKIRDRVLLTHSPKDRRKLKSALDQFISQLGQLIHGC